jgi:hypothetical protein
MRTNKIKRRSAAYHNVREAALVPGTIVVIPGPQLVHDGEIFYQIGDWSGFSSVLEVGIFMDGKKLDPKATPMTIKELAQSQLTRRSYGADVKEVHMIDGKADRRLSATNFVSIQHEWEFIPTEGEAGADDQVGEEFITKPVAYRVTSERKEYAFPTYQDGKIATDEYDNVVLEFRTLPTLVPVQVPQEWYDTVSAKIQDKLADKESVLGDKVDVLKAFARDHKLYTTAEEEKYFPKVEVAEEPKVEEVTTEAKSTKARTKTTKAKSTKKNSKA